MCPTCDNPFGNPDYCPICLGQGLVWVQATGPMTLTKGKTVEVPPASWRKADVELEGVFEARPHVHGMEPNTTPYHGLAIRAVLRRRSFLWTLYWKGKKITSGLGDLPSVKHAMTMTRR